MKKRISTLNHDVEDEYRTQRLSGERIDVNEFLDKYKLDEIEKRHLVRRFQRWESSMSGFKRYYNSIDSDVQFKKIIERINEANSNKEWANTQSKDIDKLENEINWETVRSKRILPQIRQPQTSGVEKQENKVHNLNSQIVDTIQIIFTVSLAIDKYMSQRGKISTRVSRGIQRGKTDQVTITNHVDSIQIDITVGTEDTLAKCSLTIQLTDKNTGNGFPDVNILLSKENGEVVSFDKTNSSGMARFFCPYGIYSLIIELEGKIKINLDLFVPK